MSKFCKVEDCRSRSHCKGFCKSHYNKWYKNKIDDNGNPINGYQPLATVCRFPKCEKTRKDHLRNGLCNKHRKWAEKGIIDKDTCEILDESRIPEGRKYIHCSISGCLGKHKAHGLCNKHYRAWKVQKSIYKDGTIAYGVREKYDYSKRQSCRVRECTRIIDGKHRSRRLVKGFCSYHYGLHKKGYYNEWGIPIKEKDFLSGAELKKARKKALRDYTKSRSIHIEWDGQKKTIKRWSQITKIKKGTIKTRYMAGLPVEFIFHKGSLRNCQKYKDWKKQRSCEEALC